MTKHTCYVCYREVETRVIIRNDKTKERTALICFIFCQSSKKIYKIILKIREKC